MPFTHVGGVAGKSGTIAMQQKIGKLRKRIAELEQVVVERNRCIKQLKAENAKLQAENKNLIANYEMLSVSYTDSKRVCEHLFTELKRYKSLLRAKLPERELMLIDEIQKLRERCADLYAEMITYSDAPNYNASVWAPKLRELGIEVS